MVVKEDTRNAVVLVIDDDEDMRQLLKIFLTEQGYEVAAAPNGAEGLEQLRRVRPCLILLDLMMPVMDGRTFRREQLKDERVAEIPVVCVSGAHNPGETAREIHAAHCLVKPVDFDQLFQVVRTHCRSR